MRLATLTLFLFCSQSFADALDEVNAARAQRGLAPFIRDDGLTIAATRAAEYRAERLMFGHCPNDFVHLPSGCRADAAGCAAYPVGYGWLSCCTFERYTYAGAAYAIGRDNKRYMHLFVRVGGAPAIVASEPKKVEPLPPPKAVAPCPATAPVAVYVPLTLVERIRERRVTRLQDAQARSFSRLFGWGCCR